jgi:hypothetical protein
MRDWGANEFLPNRFEGCLIAEEHKNGWKLKFRSIVEPDVLSKGQMKELVFQDSLHVRDCQGVLIWGLFRFVRK